MRGNENYRELVEKGNSLDRARLSNRVSILQKNRRYMSKAQRIDSESSNGKALKVISPVTSEWHNIKWNNIREQIEILQGQTVDATKRKDFKEVYRLQRLLVTSFAGRALAVRKVATNSGGKTAGIDKIVWNGPQDYWKAIGTLRVITLNPKGYKAQPLRRVEIPKDNGETRPLGIPTLLDRTVQAVYHLALDPVVETQSDLNSYGFRKGRSTHDAITAIRNHLDKSNHPRWVLDADLSKCFDRINHKFLLENTPICDKNVLSQWLKSGVMIEETFSETTDGTPQGGIISPTLCNVALNGIEAVALQAVERIKGISSGVHLIRYADDMIVTGKNTEILKQVKIAMQTFLKERGLEFNEKKTRIVHVKEGFDFLGFRISRKDWNPKLNKITMQDTVLIIEPSNKGIIKLKDKISKAIIKDSPLERIISELNPILRGWGEHKRISYHSQNSFIKIDHYVYQKMIKWVAGHGGSLKRTLAKYVTKSNNRKWNWGLSDTLKLINLGEIPILTMRLLKFDKNPYNLNDKEYFELRREKLIFARFRAAIYRKFNNKCVLCGESLHNEEDIELHHIKPVKEGGKYKLDNILPLHRICHQQVTHNKIIEQDLIKIYTKASK